MSEWQVERIRQLERDRAQMRYELESQTTAALVYAALAVVGWGAFVVVLIAC